MPSLDIQFNFSNVPSDLVEKIMDAINNKQPFGLTNGRTLNVFDPETLTGAFNGKTRVYISGPAVFQYENINRLIEGVSLALLSCKEFVPAVNLPKLNIPVQKTLTIQDESVSLKSYIKKLIGA